MLQSCDTLIHLKFDVWTSTNHVPYLGIVGQYHDQNLNIIEVVLGCIEIEGAHTGENLAGYVLDVLDWYGIHKLVSCETNLCYTVSLQKFFSKHLCFIPGGVHPK